LDTSIVSVHPIPDPTPVQVLDDDIAQVVSGKKKKGKKGRTQARLLEEDETAGASVSYTARDAPFDPDEDLLAGEDLP
jgi:hypothetical protein